MKNKILLVILAFILINAIEAQVDGREVSKLKVDTKSVPLAALMSATVPGAGQIYLGQKTKAGVFLAADLITIFSLYRFNLEQDIAVNNYKQYALVNAGLRMGVDKDVYIYASKYRSATEYNLAMETFYKNYLLIDYITQEEFNEYVLRDRLGPEDWWEWQSDAQFKKYRSIRQQKQEFEQYASLAVGILIVNRIISVVDAAITTNKINTANRQLYTTSDVERKGITLNYEIRF